MARTTRPESKKTSGRFKQIWEVFQITRRRKPVVQWWMLLAFVVPTGIGVGLGFVFGREGGLAYTIPMWTVVGMLSGLLVTIIVLGRVAERSAYEQIDGQPGAIGAVLRNGLRGTWKGNEMPVAVNPKTRDAVYRAVGRTGIVLLGEGSPERVKRMLDDERKKVERVLPNVPIRSYTVGSAGHEVKLHRIVPTLRKGKRALTRQEILAVSNRLNSLQASLPIPKGIDPMKMRPQRGRMR